MVTASSEADLLRLVQHSLAAEAGSPRISGACRASVEVTTRRIHGSTSWRVGLLWPRGRSGAPCPSRP